MLSLIKNLNEFFLERSGLILVIKSWVKLAKQLDNNSNYLLHSEKKPEWFRKVIQFLFLQVRTFLYWIVTGFALFRNEFEGGGRRRAAAAVRLHHLAFLAGDDVVAVVDVVVVKVVKVVAAAATVRLAQNLPVDYRHLWRRGRHRRVHNIPCKTSQFKGVILWRDDIHVWRCDTLKRFFLLLSLFWHNHYYSAMTITFLATTWRHLHPSKRCTLEARPLVCSPLNVRSAFNLFFVVGRSRRRRLKITWWDLKPEIQQSREKKSFS